MKSKFSIEGHPLHPALIALPIGLFIWAFVADIVYLATDKNALWYDISFYTGIAAIITALIAALPGFGDYLTMSMSSGERLVATLHMLFNLAVVGLFFIAMIIAWDSGATGGAELWMVIILHAIGVGLLTVGGWLGGHMVYVYHFAMVPENEAEEYRVVPGSRRGHHEESREHRASTR